MLKNNSNKNALIFSHSSQLAGAERSLLELIGELSCEYNVQSTTIVPNPGPLVDILRSKGMDVIIAPLHWWCNVGDLLEKSTRDEQNYISYAWIKSNLIKLKSLNPSVIISNTIVMPWGAVTSHLLNIPHIWMINEFGERDHNLSFHLPFHQITTIVEETSDKIALCSNAVKNVLFPNIKSDQAETIYYYIEPPEIKTNEIHANPDFNNPHTCHLILSGTISESKGQEDAVRAVLELALNRHKNVDLVMVGYTTLEFEQYLDKIIKSNNAQDYIHILPFTEDVLKIVDQADIVLVCSEMEAFGRVTLEAMLMKKPLVTTNTGGTTEMVKEGETGLLYNPGNHIQLADRIEELINDSELQKRLAINAYQFATRKFTKENFGGRYFEIINELKHVENKPQPVFDTFLATLEKSQKTTGKSTQIKKFLKNLLKKLPG